MTDVQVGHNGMTEGDCSDVYATESARFYMTASRVRRMVSIKVYRDLFGVEHVLYSINIQKY